MLKAILDLLVTCTVLLFDRIALYGGKRSKSSLKRLLLVRIDYIGDFIIWLDTARYFRQYYPDHHITLVVYEPCVPLARQFPYWDAILPLNLKRFRFNPLYRFHYLRRIRKSGFEIAIQPVHSRAFFCGDAIIHASAAKERIGSTGDNSNITAVRKRISDRWYSKLILIKSPVELKRNSDFVKKLFNIELNPHLYKLPLILNLRKELQFNRSYYVLFPGASSIHRRWPIANFIEIASIIHRKTGWLGVVCGGKDETGLCGRIVENSTTPIINLAGRTTLLELIEVIRHSAFFIGNETSGIHIAAALRTPSVCILGGGQNNRFLPYLVDDNEKTCLPVTVIHSMPCFGCDWRCKYTLKQEATFPCIENITVTDVAEAVMKCFSLMSET